MRKLVLSTLTLAMSGLFSQSALAENFNINSSIPLTIHGFAQTGTAFSTSNHKYVQPYRGSISDGFNFDEPTLAGLQLTAALNKQFSITTQIVASGKDTDGDSSYQMKLDWAFIKYQLNRDVQFRAGRFRTPAFLYSDTMDVSYSYPWVDLPGEVYRLVPFSNINGADAIFTRGLGHSDWALTLQPFVGSASTRYNIDLAPGAEPTSETETNARFKVHNIYGFNASIGNPMLTLRANYMHGSVSASNLPTIMAATSPVNNENADFYGVGAKVDIHNLIGIAEYAHRNVNGKIPNLTGWYTLVGYQIGKFMPNFTYAKLKTTDENKRTDAYSKNLNQDQKSYTLGLDYQITDHIVAKASASRVYALDGTRGLFETKPGGPVNIYRLGLSAFF